jgi:hypothetical protein
MKSPDLEWMAGSIQMQNLGLCIGYLWTICHHRRKNIQPYWSTDCTCFQTSDLLSLQSSFARSINISNLLCVGPRLARYLSRMEASNPYSLGSGMSSCGSGYDGIWRNGTLSLQHLRITEKADVDIERMRQKSLLHQSPCTVSSEQPMISQT